MLEEKISMTMNQFSAVRGTSCVSPLKISLTDSAIFVALSFYVLSLRGSVRLRSRERDGQKKILLGVVNTLSARKSLVVGKEYVRHIN